ncbi:DUF6475 domain-containing protein [Planctomicrobium piriforme]|uniref:DUF6475 domain-containing protein n=1 Tax=Planctomicrobium piriforme TaxID=1576369 RepID=A0A1I3EHP4_9PLAN|nr:DUF6475 domain-containing protein [Planctomicrobium piriforme]SFH98477.1 hypothetical protein SAMN05421753_104227 [Planctomicrobium piriforme]
MNQMSRSDSITQRKADLRKILESFFGLRNIKLTADQLKSWIDALIDLKVSDVQVAVDRFNRECTDYPSPAALRKFAPVLNDAERAAKAWTSVRKQIRCFGSMRTINFQDRIINAAIRTRWTWEKLCGLSSEEMVWAEKHFIQAYLVIAKTGQGDASPLPGIAERENRSRGLPSPETVEIHSGLPEHPIAKHLEYVPLNNKQAPQAIEYKPKTAGLIPEFSVPKDVSDEVAKEEAVRDQSRRQQRPGRHPKATQEGRGQSRRGDAIDG